MRIVHVTDCYLPRTGGIEWHVHDLARNQQRAGHHVEVVTATVGRTLADDLVVHRPAPRRDEDGTIVLRGLVGRRVTALHADVVHVHASAFSPLGFLTATEAVRSGVPVAMTVHSFWDRATVAFRASHAVSGWANWPVAWSAVSRAAAAPLRTLLGGVDVVPNATDSAWWRDAGRATTCDGLSIVSVMRMTGRKRPLPLLSMLHNLRRMVPPEVRLRATLVGDGPQLPAVRRMIATTELRAWVQAPGAASRHQVRDNFARHDVYVAPATLESFGIAALEARSAGLPIVARAGTGVVDFVRDGREGLIADSDTAMVTALARLATDAAMRERITQHNNQEAPLPTWAAVLHACDRLYLRAARLAGVRDGTHGRRDGVRVGAMTDRNAPNVRQPVDA